MSNSCSTGVCGSHTYSNITQIKVNLILAELKSHHVTLSGDNPWTINPNSHGVTLCGAWDSTTSVLTITVLTKSWYVPCKSVWDYIDTLIHHISTLTDSELM